jgi:hypothetical protein
MAQANIGKKHWPGETGPDDPNSGEDEKSSKPKK